MKPLEKIKKLYDGDSLMTYRELLISILNNSEAILRLKNGILVQTTLKSDNTL